MIKFYINKWWWFPVNFIINIFLMIPLFNWNLNDKICFTIGFILLVTNIILLIFKNSIKNEFINRTKIS